MRKPVAPFVLIDSIRARTVSVSPSRSGRSYRYSWEPWTTRVKSSPSAGSPITCGKTANSAAVTNVGGTPSFCPKTSRNAATRPGSTTKGTSGYRVPSAAGFIGGRR